MNGDRMDWLHKFKEDGGKLPSREECLRLLDR
jgi:hypothetical protein